MVSAISSKDIDGALDLLLAPLNRSLDDLLKAVADGGMLITADRRQRLYRLAWRLAEAGITFVDADDAAVTFGSVLCTTAEDQTALQREIHKTWSRVPVPGKDFFARKKPAADDGPAPERPPSKVALALARISARPLLIASVLVAIVSALGLAIWYIAGHPGIASSGSTGGGNTSGPSTDLLATAVVDLWQRAVAALPAAVAAWLAWTWWQPMTSAISREQGSAERLEKFTRPDLNTLFRGTTARLAFDTLRRAVRTESSRVDVPSSLRATVRAAGWPTIRRATSRNSLEVVLFVDREGTADHLAFLAQLLEDRLRAAGAMVTRYDFRLTPTRLTQVSGRPDGAAVENVERIVARHVGQRLILISEGYGLVEGKHLDDELRLRRLLSEFAQVHILTPTPEDCWEERERCLLQAGFNVAFCDREGIEDTARISTLVDWTEPLAATIRNIHGEPDPLLAHLESEYHRYAVDYPVLQPPKGAPDGPIETAGLSALQIRSLVSALLAWMGSRPAFRLLVSIAVFPTVKPAYTMALADALSQDAEAPGAVLDEKLYARLARLPWMRDGRFPDWLRLVLARRLTEGERAAMARAHVKLLAPMAVARGDIVAQASLEIARRSLRANMDPDHPMAERLFLAMLFGQSPKADLLRPQATTAITEALGEQRKRAPRIVAAGFLVAAILCFLFKDEVVLPALAAASSWFTTVWIPRLPVGPTAQAAIYTSIACSVIAMFWPRQSADPAPATSPVLTTPNSAAAPWKATLVLRLFGTASATLLLTRPAAPWSVRFVLSLFAVAFGMFGLKGGVGPDEVSATATSVLSLVSCATLLFERHPAWNGGLWIIPDIDEATAGETAPLPQYALPDTIVSHAMLAPSLAASGLLILVFFCAYGTLAVATTGNLAPITIPAIAAGWTATFVAMRRVILGSWLLNGPSGVRRHLLTDFFAAATAVSILFIARGPASETPAIGAAATVVMLIMFAYTLGLRPWVTPIAQGDRVRANVAVMFFTPAMALGAAGIALIATDSFPIFAIAWVAAVILHFVASVALVPIIGISVSRRERFFIATHQLWASRRLWVPAILMLAPGLLLLWVTEQYSKPSFMGVSLKEEFRWMGFILSTLSFWPMFRVFGAVPLIEGLKAQQSSSTSTSNTASLRSFLDTPWWATIVLASCLLPNWAKSLPVLLGFVSANVLLAAPLICIAFAHRYGRAALWPLALGLLPHIVAAHSDLVLRGEPGFVVAMLFWARFVADPALRRSLLARETLPLPDLLVLAVAFAFTVTINLPGTITALRYDPDWLVLTTAFVIGLSRMPPWRFLLLLGILAISRLGIDLGSVAHAEIATIPRAIFPPVPVPLPALLLYGLPWTTAVAAAMVTVLTRAYLRRAMISDDPGSSWSSPPGHLWARFSRALSTARLPFILFTVAQIAWLFKSLLYGKTSHLEPLLESMSRSPVVAVAGLMLGLTAVRLLDSLIIAVLVPAMLIAILFLDTGLSIAPFGTPVNVALIIASAYPCNAALGFAIRLIAEGRWQFPKSWSEFRRHLVLPIVWPFSDVISKVETPQSSASQVPEEPIGPDPDRPPEVMREPTKSEDEPSPETSKRGVKKSSQPPRKRPRK